MKNIVYGLTDSRNDLVYYVGKSSVGDTRALSHLRNSHSAEVNKWVSDVRDNWGDINVILIEEVSDIGFLNEREQHWISYYAKLNENILNKNGANIILNECYDTEDEDKFQELRRSILFAGDIVKKRRLALSITQTELVKVTNVSRWTLSQLENGVDISIQSLKNIILGLTKIAMDRKISKTLNKHRVSNQKQTK